MPIQPLDPPARCWLCGSTDAAPYETAGRWSYVRCRECSLVFLFPRPTPARLHAMTRQEWAGEGGTTQGEIETRVATNAERVAFLNGLHPPGRLLEIGCGSGAFLEAARSQGWSVLGLEPVEPAAGVARSSFRLDVRAAEIEGADLPPNSFDAAVLLHTLMRMPDPARTLREAGRALRPGGVIYLETPNLACPEAALRRVFHDRIFVAPFHLFAFSPATLRRFLEQAGFTDITTQPYVTPALSRGIRRGRKFLQSLMPSKRLVEGPGGAPRGTPRRKRSDTTVARMKRVVQRLLPGYGMYAWAVK